MSLPVAWVEKIWAKLTLTYGDKFLRQYSSIPADQLCAVKSDWCYELAAYQSRPDAIAYVLSNLPEDPPNVIKFKALLRTAPKPVQAAIENRPREDPQRLVEELSKLLTKKETVTKLAYNPKQWAIDLQARIATGYCATEAQRNMSKAALNQSLFAEDVDSL